MQQQPNYRCPDAGFHMDTTELLPDPYNTEKMECVRPHFMEHISRYMKAKTAIDAFFEIQGLISIGIGFIENEEKVKAIRDKLRGHGSEGINNRTKATNFLNTHKTHYEANINWEIIWEAEIFELLPQLRDVWFDVQKCLVEEGKLVWTSRDPIAELEGELIENALDELRHIQEEEDIEPELNIKDISQIRDINQHRFVPPLVSKDSEAESEFKGAEQEDLETNLAMGADSRARDTKNTLIFD